MNSTVTKARRTNDGFPTWPGPAASDTADTSASGTGPGWQGWLRPVHDGLREQGKQKEGLDDKTHEEQHEELELHDHAKGDQVQEKERGQGSRGGAGQVEELGGDHEASSGLHGGLVERFRGQERKTSASRAEETTMGIASPVSQGLGAERGAAKGGLAGLRPPRRQEKRRQGRQEASRVSRPAAAHDLNNAPQEESHLREPLPIQSQQEIAEGDRILH